MPENLPSRCSAVKLQRIQSRFDVLHVFALSARSQVSALSGGDHFNLPALP